MPKVYRLGQLGRLAISAKPSVIPVFLLLWAGLSVVAYSFLHLSLATALLGGLAATCLHYLSDLWHQLSHTLAARRTGHPMVGIQFWGALSTSLYPADEGDLPKEVHLTRALGGPLGSLALSVLAGFLAFAFFPAGSVARWLLVFLFLDNLLAFTLGALLPLGFTDGSTLLRWIRR